MIDSKKMKLSGDSRWLQTSLRHDQTSFAPTNTRKVFFSVHLVRLGGSYTLFRGYSEMTATRKVDPILGDRAMHGQPCSTAYT